MLIYSGGRLNKKKNKTLTSERETDKDRQRQTQTDRQRHTERDRQRQTDGEREREETASQPASFPIDNAVAHLFCLTALATGPTRKTKTPTCGHLISYSYSSNVSGDPKPSPPLPLQQ